MSNRQKNGEKHSESCGINARGSAAWEREQMKINGEYNKQKYQALSACVHCKSSNINCPCTTAAQPYFRNK